MAGKRFVRTAKRLSSWFQFVPTTTAFSAGGGTILFQLNAAALALRPFTIVRTRFLLGMQTDQIAASEDQVGALGMAVVSDQASAVGVTAVPTPLTDMASDLWFVHQLMYGALLRADGTGIDAGAMLTTEVDSKAMRKVDIGQDMVIVGELSSGASAGFTLTVGGRILVKVN